MIFPLSPVEMSVVVTFSPSSVNVVISVAFSGSSVAFPSNVVDVSV